MEVGEEQLDAALSLASRQKQRNDDSRLSREHIYGKDGGESKRTDSAKTTRRVRLARGETRSNQDNHEKTQQPETTAIRKLRAGTPAHVWVVQALF